MTITVYSKPMCVQCDATKRAFTKAGVSFDVVDITEDASALAPVVVAGEDHWSGFRPDKIKAISGAAAGATGFARSAV
jgi:glutaredoxin-like protein NrdH